MYSAAARERSPFSRSAPASPVSGRPRKDPATGNGAEPGAGHDGQPVGSPLTARKSNRSPWFPIRQKNPRLLRQVTRIQRALREFFTERVLFGEGSTTPADCWGARTSRPRRGTCTSTTRNWLTRRISSSRMVSDGYSAILPPACSKNLSRQAVVKRPRRGGQTLCQVSSCAVST